MEVVPPRRVVDIDAPHTLLHELDDFGFLLVSWALVAWCLRLVWLASWHRQLRTAAAVQSLSTFSDVALHSLVSTLDPSTRRKFLNFLRARTPDEPTAPVVHYESPISIHRVGAARSVAAAAAATNVASLEVHYDSSRAAMVQAFWGVDIAQLLALPSLPAAPSSASSTKAGHGGALATTSTGSRRGEEGAPPVSSRAFSAAASCGTRSRSALRRHLPTRSSPSPVVHQFDTIELTNLRDACAAAGSLGGHASGGGSGAGGHDDAAAPTVQDRPTCTLPDAIFARVSPPIPLPAGLGLSVAIDAPPPATSGPPGGDGPVVLLFSAFSEVAGVAVAARDGALPAPLKGLRGTCAQAFVAVVEVAAPDAADGASAAAAAREAAVDEEEHGEGRGDGGDDVEAGGGDGSRRRGGGGGSNGGVLTGTVRNQLLATPNGLLELCEVFGLDGSGGGDGAEAEEGEQDETCVACLTDPRDTILLPCRHLCVCSACFEQLASDLCPVCRAPFASYLRFGAAAADAGSGGGSGATAAACAVSTPSASTSLAADGSGGGVDYNAEPAAAAAVDEAPANGAIPWNGTLATAAVAGGPSAAATSAEP